MKQIRNFFQEKGWEIVYSFETDERHAKYQDIDKLGLSNAARLVLSHFDKGIYQHQCMAISQFQKGDNVCISTSTSSGKTLIFNICGIETLSKNPDAKILAIYPLKALGSEQEKRWKKVIYDSKLPYKIGRIDGAVSQNEREKIIKNSSIVIITPDVIHAWLLSKLSNGFVFNFLKNIALIVIDEAHTYSGVFGSNGAFLYRRLQHIISKAGGKYQIVAASATIKNPSEHLNKLTGLNFSIIGDEYETSPKMKNKIFLVNPPTTSDLLTSLPNLMRFVVYNTNYQFITFVDSRKQTEYLATISARKVEKESIDDEIRNIDINFIQDLSVCPYRSGYEEIDRNKIQEKLTTGDLRGVISTSALEMGIDIPHLNLGILVGIPNSATSFYQRIGRIGRHQEGVIIIINNGSIQTESIFREPERLLDMPLSESALYLDNPRIQYIHALCIARQGGEDDCLKTSIGLDQEEFSLATFFPKSFVELCNSERIGEISTEFQTMKAQAGEDPNHIYPLRDVDVQYKVECKQGPNLRNLGSLGFAQVMREAYPGAVYYYQTQTFRVYRLNPYKHLIEVRPEKKYTTKPISLPTLIFPNLSDGNIIESKKFGELIIIECNLQIRESISGLIETRGRNEIEIAYPLDKSNGLYFDTPRFTRNYFTSGIIINHPSLNGNVKCQSLAEIIYEAFFMVIPFERQDINYGSDKHRAERKDFSKGSRFISIFDQTYGSLRLTSKFLEHDILKKIFSFAIDIAENDLRYQSYRDEINVLRDINTSLNIPEETISIEDKSISLIDSNHEKIILPNSVGLDVRDGRNEEFFIDDVFYSPKMGLAYKGRHLSEINIEETSKAGVPIIVIPISALKEIPGESKIGIYDIEIGEIVNKEQ